MSANALRARHFHTTRPSGCGGRAAPAARDAARAATTLDTLRRDAGEDKNPMPAILDCVRAEVSLGEISNAPREIYGEHHDSLAG